MKNMLISSSHPSHYMYFFAVLNFFKIIFLVIFIDDRMVEDVERKGSEGDGGGNMFQRAVGWTI